MIYESFNDSKRYKILLVYEVYVLQEALKIRII